MKQVTRASVPEWSRKIFIDSKSAQKSLATYTINLDRTVTCLAMKMAIQRFIEKNTCHVQRIFFCETVILLTPTIAE